MRRGFNPPDSSEPQVIPNNGHVTLTIIGIRLVTTYEHPNTHAYRIESLRANVHLIPIITCQLEPPFFKFNSVACYKTQRVRPFCHGVGSS